MRSLVGWLSYNKLVINLKKSKTESMVFGTAKRLASHENVSFSVKVGSIEINNTKFYTYLGVLLDQSLTLNQHLQMIIKKISGKLRLFQKFRPSLSTSASVTVYKSVIFPLMTYSSLLQLDLSDTWRNKFDSIYSSSFQKNYS